MKDNKYIGKECRRCGETLRYIKSSKCVACTSARYKRWSSKNKQALRDKNQTWYQENKEQARQSNSTWQQKNASKLNSKARKRYADNSEHVLSVNKRWRDSKQGKETVQTYEKKRYRHTQLSQYGLTVEDYDSILQQQQGGCAICRSLPTVRRLAVDHCHETGRVRGLLCGPCNMGLGLFKDKPNLLNTAAHYLKDNRGIQ